MFQKAECVVIVEYNGIPNISLSTPDYIKIPILRISHINGLFHFKKSDFFTLFVVLYFFPPIDLHCFLPVLCLYWDTFIFFTLGVKIVLSEQFLAGY